ncbi:hypothetical protein NE237_001843 [Protea cynaroides]|uniref:Uncharacterized protein n=1 Tax=Protea cynaroides TaxID=273540 RepID=A0A9Q0QYS3_9MAGN|nr:hypothetical protein NE237_001843 [Protea cynaroides]
MTGLQKKKIALKIQTDEVGRRYYRKPKKKKKSYLKQNGYLPPRRCLPASNFLLPLKQNGYLKNISTVSLPSEAISFRVPALLLQSGKCFPALTDLSTFFLLYPLFPL